MEYSRAYVALLLRNIAESSVDERLDMGRAIGTLASLDKRFLWYVVSGYSLRAAGRHIGKPNNTARRFNRICRSLAMVLNGGTV